MKTRIVVDAVKKVMEEKNYFIIFLVTMLIFLILLISIPVFAIPGNSLKFQLEVFTPLNYLVMLMLSALVGLMISMRVYDYKTKKSFGKVGGGISGGFFGFIAGIFGTASCPLCVAALFGFLGTGTVLFLIDKQWYVTGISAIFLLLSIYFTSLSIEKKCEKCQ